MPLRAFGYIASAVAIARHLPHAQVQMVHTLHTAERVNGVGAAESRRGAERFAGLGRLMLAASGSDFDPQRLTFLIDPRAPLEVGEAAVAAALKRLPEGPREALLASGARRGADPTPYVAAHLQMHDTAADLAPLRCDDTAPAEAARVISVGAQSERNFYLARMACREEGIAVPGQVATAQLFTRHVLPPYQFTRQGSEPHMQELLAAEPIRQPLEWAPDPFTVAVGNLSVARDLTYLQSFMLQGVPTHA
jgi:hypothetical protein